MINIIKKAWNAIKSGFRKLGELLHIIKPRTEESQQNLPAAKADASNIPTQEERAQSQSLPGPQNRGKSHVNWLAACDKKPHSPNSHSL